jgi:hypothetical protein
MESNETVGARWVAVYEGFGSALSVTALRAVRVGARLCAGREGDVLVGVRTANQGISRVAVDVLVTPAGWQISVRNRNGAFLHPWAQPWRLAAGESSLNWPLVGIRLRHESDASQHWVLLGAHDLTVTPAGPMAIDLGTTQTDRAALPSQLPPAEREALKVVFEELLSWPPRYPAAPHLLKQAARRIGISVSGLQDRLKAARRRATTLGAIDEGSLTDPGYLYALVCGGYLPLPRVGPAEWCPDRNLRTGYA